MNELANRFHYFVSNFQASGAPLYAHLAASCGAELGQTPEGPFAAALEPFADEPFRHFLPLRLFAEIHRRVLGGELPELMRFYPTAGGREHPRGAWPLFRAAVVELADELPSLLANPLQHNEPLRAAALAIGFLTLARELDRPLALLEVGTSAGLLLRWDHYRDRWWFRGLFDAPVLSGTVQVSSRRGCDLNPLSIATHADAIRLKSYVWADLAAHAMMLDDAIAVARNVPVTIDQADGADWLEERLLDRRAGEVTVVFHSLMRASGPQESLGRMEELLQQHGVRVTDDAPLAYLRFEVPFDPAPMPSQEQQKPMAASRLVETRLTVWPGTGLDGYERLLATSDLNGRHVRWLATSAAAGPTGR